MADQKDQNDQKRNFLRRGEGLKRFGEYNPPLPTTLKKVERRKTFVKFAEPKDTLKFLPKEIFEDSINLSTEIPKIAPPKIIHTPLRPKRHALGTIINQDSSINFDTPTPPPKNNTCVSSMSRRISSIQSKLHDLGDIHSKSCCSNQRPVTRAAARAAKTKPGPSAPADKFREVMDILNQELADLKVEIESLNN